MSYQTAAINRSIARILIAIALMLGACTGLRAQTMNFPVREVSTLLPASALSATVPNVLYIRNDARLSMLANPGNFFNSVKYKSNRTNVRLMINHDYAAIPAQPYVYKMMYQLQGSSKQGDSAYNFTVTDSLMIAYNPDSLTAFQDMQLKTYSGLFNAKLTILQIYNMSSGTPVPVAFGATAKNFNIQLDMQYQAYAKTHYIPADMGLNTSSSFDAARQVLNISWTPQITPLLGNVTPAQYELEWTYADNYAADGSELSINAVQYAFRNNATRIITDSSNYGIPIVYPKGYIVFRVRMLRVDSNLYQYPIYGIWSLPNNGGSVGSVNSPAYVYKITKAHTADQLNWNASLSFAEGGKYKQVLGYFDGMLKNRQTVTRFNTNPGLLLLTENIYDYEGRPAITTLPSVVKSDSFTYTGKVSVSSISGNPYGPADFDVKPAACPDEVIVPPFTAASLANRYYSTLNTDIGGMQRYVPQAKGYPFIHTRLSPGYSDRVDKQGGAGDILQIGMGHETQYQYVNADQPDLNQLFGLNAGFKNFYTKTMVKDPNGQLSMQLKDYQGKQIATALVGTSVDTSRTAIMFNDEAGNNGKFRSDQLANTTQLIVGHERKYNGNYFMDMDAMVNITYEYAFAPYMVCPAPYLGLSVKGSFDYTITDDCGVQRLHKFGTLGETGVINDPATHTATKSTDTTLNKGKYTIDKTLSIATSDIYAAVDSFFEYSPNCAKTEAQFVREEVENTPFPCKDDVEDPCAALRRRMMEELFPKAKYGQYTNTGTISGNGVDPSIFDITTAGDGTRKYRYQSPCVAPALNSLVINKYGRNYTNLADLPVDTFLFVYTGADRYTIAAVLLPLHPEYCRLKNCFVDEFKARLKAIPDAAAARQNKTFELDQLIDGDNVLRQKMMQPPISMTYIDDSLRLMFGGTMRMDTMALEIAYCSNDDVLAYGDAKNIFHQYIVDHKFESDQVRDVYFKRLRDLYLVNREKYVSIALTAGGNDCEPCSEARMSLVAPALVTVAYNPDGTFNLGTGGLLGLFSGSLQSSLAGILNSSTVPVNDPDEIAMMQDSAARMVRASDSLLCYIGVDSVLARLVNCNATAAQRGDLKAALISLITSGQVHNGLFLPEQVRWALDEAGIGVDDLCHPFLVTYDYYNSTGGKRGTCFAGDYYNDVTEFFNDYQIMYALRQTADGSPFTFTTWSWNMANNFGRQLSDAVPGNTYIPISIHSEYDAATKMYRLAFYRSGYVDSVIVSLRTPSEVMVDGTSYPLFYQNYNSLQFDHVSCYYEDPLAVAEGHIGRFLFRAAVTRTDALYGGAQIQTTKADLLGWNNGKIYMNDAGTGPLADCVPCTQFKDYFEAFMDYMKPLNTAHPDYYAADHVFFFKSLRNFMNYNLKKVFSEDQYHRFMNSCAIADHYAGDIINHTGYAFLNITSAAFNTFKQQLLQTDSVNLQPMLDMYFPGHTGDYLLFDYKDVPFSKVRIVNDKIVAAGGTVNASFFSAAIGVLLLPPGLNINDITAGLPCSAVSGGSAIIRRNNHDYTYQYYTIQNSGGTPVGISARISQYLAAHNIYAYWLPWYYEAANDDYFKPEKQALLDYTYAMDGLPAGKVLDSLQDFWIHNNIAAFNSGDVSYANPENPDRVTDLYYANSSNVYPGYTTMQQLLVWVKATLTGNKIIIPGTPNTVTITNGVPAGASLKVYRCADGLYWYRYFDPNNKLYNFYVRIPDYVYAPNRQYVDAIRILPANGDTDTRRFTVELDLWGETMYAEGSADFDIAWSKKLSDVLLGNEDNIHPSEKLSGQVGGADNCEQLRLANAVYTGKIKYLNYIDSFKQSLKAAFYAHVMGQLNEKLWIEYMDARFAYTLYNYDLAGNLVQTVPPVGVHKLPASVNSTVDQLRNSNQFAANAIPQHTKVTRYEYNTADKPLIEVTPDAGQKTLTYDQKGNVILSQSEKQRSKGLFTYMLYDGQNRMVETGEVLWNSPGCVPFADKPLYQKQGGVWVKTARPNPCACENATDSLWQFCVPDYSGHYDNQSFATDIRKKSRTQVVATVYDYELQNLGTIAGMSRQQNLRSRIAASMYFESCAPDYAGNAPTSGYVSASHYSYDAAGNVQTVTQDIPDLDGMHQRYKRIDYEYDLLSGKVNMVAYNRGKADQLYQRYNYDADNRIVKAESSHDGMIWKRDAEYSYYQHGPLARTSLGDLRVQGMDYAYTLQGWLKAINADRNDPKLDMGADDGINAVTASDVYATSIDYFDGDYTPIGSAASLQLQKPAKNLYNGNIARTTNDVAPFGALATTYTYDQQNRLRNARYGTMAADVVNFNNWYASSYKYDLDGNIRQLTRRENTGALMDSMSYTYSNPNNNRLGNVLEYAAMNLPALQDIKPYTAAASTRFLYDENGNIVKDLTSNTDTIKWNIYGKTTDLVNNDKKLSLHFLYDAKGDRVAKKSTVLTDTGSIEDNTYYVRDASGNIMAEYNVSRNWSKAEKIQWVKAVFDWTNLHFDPYLPGGWIYGLNLAGYLKAPEFAGYVTGLGITLSYPAGYYIAKDPALLKSMVSSGDALKALGDYCLKGTNKPGADAFMEATFGPRANAYFINSSWQNIFTNSNPARLRYATDQLVANCPVFVSDMAARFGLDALRGDMKKAAFDIASYVPGYYDDWLHDALYFHDNPQAIINPWLQQVTSDNSYLSDPNLNIDGGYVPGLRNVLAQYGDDAAAKQAKTLAVDKSTVGIYAFASSWSPAMDLVPPGAKTGLSYYDDPVAYIKAVAATKGSLDFTTQAVAQIASLDVLSLAGIFGAHIHELDASIWTSPSLRKQSISLASHHLYGSKRIGINAYWPQQYNSSWDFQNNVIDTFGLNTVMPWYSQSYNDLLQPATTSPFGNGLAIAATLQHQVGQKQYELVNHLGNVQATVSDKRFAKDINGDGNRDIFKAGIQAAYDYYPFGMLMPGRFVQDAGDQCMTVNQTKMVPKQVFTPFSRWTDGIRTWDGMGNSVPVSTMGLKIVDGGFNLSYPITRDNLGNSITFTLTPDPGVSTINFDFVSDGAVPFYIETNDGRTVSLYRSGTYTLSLIPTTEPLTVYIYGNTLVSPGTPVNVQFRNFGTYTWVYEPQTTYVQICNKATDKYEFGFNGKYKDNEIAGIGNSLDFGARMYNSRLARFNAVDPLARKCPNQSTYSYADNNPIFYVDKEGKIKEAYNVIIDDRSGNVIISKTTTSDLFHKTEREADDAFGIYTHDYVNVHGWYDFKEVNVVHIDKNGHFYGFKHDIKVADKRRFETDYNYGQGVANLFDKIDRHIINNQHSESGSRDGWILTTKNRLAAGNDHQYNAKGRGEFIDVDEIAAVFSVTAYQSGAESPTNLLTAIKYMRDGALAGNDAQGGKPPMKLDFNRSKRLDSCKNCGAVLPHEVMDKQDWHPEGDIVPAKNQNQTPHQ